MAQTGLPTKPKIFTMRPFTNWQTLPGMFANSWLRARPVEAHGLGVSLNTVPCPLRARFLSAPGVPTPQGGYEDRIC